MRRGNIRCAPPPPPGLPRTSIDGKNGSQRAPAASGSSPSPGLRVGGGGRTPALRVFPGKKPVITPGSTPVDPCSKMTIQFSHRKRSN